MKIIDSRSGSVYEYMDDTGLISKNNVIVSGEEYEPVFSKDSSGEPIFCGILKKSTNRFISLSGNNSKVN